MNEVESVSNQLIVLICCISLFMVAIVTKVFLHSQIAANMHARIHTQHTHTHSTNPFSSLHTQLQLFMSIQIMWKCVNLFKTIEVDCRILKRSFLEVLSILFVSKKRRCLWWWSCCYDGILTFSSIFHFRDAISIHIFWFGSHKKVDRVEAPKASEKRPPIAGHSQ